jgi:hypothetical protein
LFDRLALGGVEAAAKLLTKAKARRLAANVAKLPELYRWGARAGTAPSGSIEALLSIARHFRAARQWPFCLTRAPEMADLIAARGRHDNKHHNQGWVKCSVRPVCDSVKIQADLPREGNACCESSS